VIFDFCKRLFIKKSTNMDSPDSQRRQKEEIERKARRGEMDPRLEFTFQLLMDATGLNRNQILDHIFEGDMVMTFFLSE
jgi:hypothetical protein